MGESSVASGPAAVRVDLTGRSTLVTGAASGIGRAWAQRLCRAGAAVTVVDLNGDTARKVAAEISGEAMQADLSKHEVLDALEVEADIQGIAFQIGLRLRQARPKGSRRSWRSREDPKA